MYRLLCVVNQAGRKRTQNVAKGTTQNTERTPPPSLQNPSLLPIPLGIVTGILAIILIILLTNWLSAVPSILPISLPMLPPMALFFAGGMLCWKYTRTLTAGALAGAIGGFLGGAGRTIADTSAILNVAAQRTDATVVGFLFLMFNATVSGFLYMFAGAFCGLLGTLAGMALARLMQQHA